jgi:hypothetical protein
VQIFGAASDKARVEDLEIRLGHRVATPTSPNGRHRPTGPASVESHWWVECADPFGRCRAMNVVVQHGRVVVVAPPGESAVLSAEQTRELGTALAKAASAAPPPDSATADDTAPDNTTAPHTTTPDTTTPDNTTARDTTTPDDSGPGTAPA